MEAQAVCPQCGGTGWRVVEREGLSGAERCDCLASERVRNLEVRASIPPLYGEASFENFFTQPDNPVAGRILTTAVTTARSYAREFPYGTKKPGLLFLGDPGTGKTHLAVAVMRILISRGFECLFFDYQDLLVRIRSSYDPASGSGRQDSYRAALECEVLVLDDLGAHRVTDWVEDTITSIITHRCNHKRPLIATSNLRDPEAGDAVLPGGTAGDLAGKYYLSERIGQRARSRLFEMCRVVTTRGAEDYRQRKGR